MSKAIADALESARREGLTHGHVLRRGAWPTLEEVEILSLARGSTHSGLDFVVAPSQQTLNLRPGSPPPGGFRLLRAPAVR